MIPANFYKNTVLLLVQKLDNVMHVYIEKKFANVFSKNTIKFI